MGITHDYKIHHVGVRRGYTRMENNSDKKYLHKRMDVSNGLGFNENQKHKKQEQC